MPTNNAAAPSHVCPGIGIHAIDIVQPPGIGIAAIADIEPHQTVVSAALVANSSTEAPKNACCEVLSRVMGHSLLSCNWLLHRYVAHPLPYSSFRRHQRPVSLRPFGARSSHGYMLQRPSSPRA